MRKFIIKLGFFIFPIIFFLLFIIIIDPYNYFFNSNFIDNKTKYLSIRRSNVVMPRGIIFWKLNAFRNAPSNNILIGDSRGVHIDTALIYEITGEKYFNFAVPGANFQTNISIFWNAVNHTRIETVYWQLGFFNYNENDLSPDLVQMVITYFQNPAKYLLKSWFWIDSFYALYYFTFPGQLQKTIPSVEERLRLRDENWNEIIKKQGLWKLEDYNYPENIFNDMKKISIYCEENEIDLNFIIFPNHPAYYDLIEKFNLEKKITRFKNDINSFGPTYDFGFENKFTVDSTIYFDLYHARQFVTDSITDYIFNHDDHKLIYEKYNIDE